MGKIRICFLFLFFISIQRIDSILTLRRFNIAISNNLGGNKKLMFNCRSKDGSTAVEFLPVNDVYSTHFVIYPKTLIWCNMWKGPDYVPQAKFDAFVGSKSFIDSVCGGMKPNTCFWQAQDSGIWVRNNTSGAFKFMYDWDTL
ncbi:putative S-protein1 [Cardamine amara subsp. amara]|uniref:S-protein homolog n=1 Tax=Cardamine amara subsp. amara TaxID=228776 RepID=A0ABD1A3R8_CARAN